MIKIFMCYMREIQGEPWEKHLYLRLSMDIVGSPDFFQEKMYSLIQTLAYIKIHLDDLLVITKSTYKDHLKKL